MFLKAPIFIKKVKLQSYPIANAKKVYKIFWNIKMEDLVLKSTVTKMEKRKITLLEELNF